MIRIDLDKSIAFIEICGTPSLEDIQASIDELLRHPDHIDRMDEIWDFRKASMESFHEQELTLLANFVRGRLAKLAQRTALLIAEDVDYGIGRMWMAYAENHDADQERQLFQNMEDAMEWLASPQQF